MAKTHFSFYIFKSISKYRNQDTDTLNYMVVNQTIPCHYYSKKV